MSIEPKKLKKLPDAPGIYFFLGARKKILYIGRATSLRNRVRSYFNGDLLAARGPWLSRMLPLIRSVEVKPTDSILESIFIESDLIKKFQPPYNTDEKDDKSFNCLVITKEKFPRILLARATDIDKASLTLKTSNVQLKTIFGPFPHGLQLRVALKILRRILPWRDASCVPCPNQKPPCRPCFNRQIGLCPGVCTGEVNALEYRTHIRRLRMFLSGKKEHIVRELEREMRSAAKRQEFEKAGELKRQLFALRHIQDVALLKKETEHRQESEKNTEGAGYRIEGYDLSHFGGKEIVGAMSVVERGVQVPREYRLFKLRSISGPHETKGLQEILRRRFTHAEWRAPHLVVVDGGSIQKNAAEKTLRELNLSIPVVASVKDDRHRSRELFGDESLIRKHHALILLAQSEAHRFVLSFQRKRRRLF